MYRAGKMAIVWPGQRHAGSQPNSHLSPGKRFRAMQQFRSRMRALALAGWHGERAGSDPEPKRKREERASLAEQGGKRPFAEIQPVSNVPSIYLHMDPSLVCAKAPDE